MGRCPSIEPPAFVHRFIGTQQSRWPKGGAPRPDTQTPRIQRQQQHARENTNARRAARPPPAAAPRAPTRPKAPRTYRLQAFNQRKHREPPRTADTPRYARHHPHTRTAASAARAPGPDTPLKCRLLSLPTRPFLAWPKEGLCQGNSPRVGRAFAWVILV